MSIMLDKKDNLILKELKKNSRQTTKQIAENINLPRITVHDRIKKMTKKGIIKKFSAIPDYEKIGLPCKVIIFVSFLPNVNVSQKELANKIAKLTRIYEVDIISGEYDLLIKARGASLKEIGKLVVEKLRQIKGVGRTLTCTCFENIKEEM